MTVKINVKTNHVEHVEHVEHVYRPIYSNKNVYEKRLYEHAHRAQVGQQINLLYDIKPDLSNSTQNLSNSTQNGNTTLNGNSKHIVTFARRRLKNRFWYLIVIMKLQIGLVLNYAILVIKN